MRETELHVRVLEFETGAELQAYVRKNGGRQARRMGGVLGGWFNPKTNPPTIAIPKVDGVHSLSAAALGHEVQHALEHARGEGHSHGM